ncbi:MAG: hypothetical protein K2G88_03275 [Oscillospiraceae bacterium]|nr:hypothetical protein [Oscillospiraceae bacterium]
MDGKTICGSRDNNYSVIQMVSAWTNKTGIVLGQKSMDEKKATKYQQFWSFWI